jgi:hypothetical protein
MGVPVPIPDVLPRGVEVEPGSITFPSARRPYIWILVGILAALLLMLGAAGGIALLALVVGALMGDAMGGFVVAVHVFSFGFMPGLGALILGGMLGYAKSNEKRPLTVAGSEGVYGGLLPPGPIAIEDLVVSGVPGRRFRIHSGRTLLAEFVPSTRERGWNYDAVTFVAQQVAANAGVSVTDERPESEWRRWELDPVFRAQAGFDARVEDNRSAFPDHHGTTPRPPRHRVDVEGMTVTVQANLFSTTRVHIDATHLHFSGRKYPLREITRADVIYSRHKTKNSTYWRGKLQIVVGDRVKTVASIRCSRHGGTGAATMNWLAAELMRQVRVAHPVRELGSDEDVPESIAAIVGRRAPQEA